ncbi:MAG: hypothetical protein LBE12_16050 [Planctomycetaceae bacterium]|nr:hypothetical protein [Planctomycetaceae bacterium]
MPQADYYPNGYHSACGTINSQLLLTIHYPLSTIHYPLFHYSAINYDECYRRIPPISSAQIYSVRGNAPLVTVCIFTLNHGRSRQHRFCGNYSDSTRL